MRPQLKIFSPEESILTEDHPAGVRVSIGQLTDFVATANRFQRQRLRDFAQDEVEIPENLYTILRAFAEMRPGA